MRLRFDTFRSVCISCGSGATCAFWLTLAAILPGAPSTATAGCGWNHGLQTNRGTDALAIDPLITGQVPSSLFATPTSPSKRAPSCNGVACSRLPFAPATPIVTYAPVAESWACLPPLANQPECHTSWLEVVEQRPRPILIEDGTFHPPRIFRRLV